MTAAEAFTELHKTGITIIATYSKQQTLGLHLDTINCLVRNLGGQEGGLLLVQHIPGVQIPILSRDKEHRGPRWTPAAISQTLSV